jgi:hypothetical protein
MAEPVAISVGEVERLLEQLQRPQVMTRRYFGVASQQRRWSTEPILRSMLVADVLPDGSYHPLARAPRRVLQIIFGIR